MLRPWHSNLGTSCKESTAYWAATAGKAIAFGTRLSRMCNWAEGTLGTANRHRFALNIGVLTETLNAPLDRSKKKARLLGWLSLKAKGRTYPPCKFQGR